MGVVARGNDRSLNYMKTLTLTFRVDDDLTSERAAEYRWAVIRALQLASGHTDGDYPPFTDEQKGLAIKMLDDWDKDTDPDWADRPQS